jgi:signal transduction histidine kinase
MLTITVEDDGPGVSDEDLPRIPARGMRIDEQAEGHGLGLAIVSDIVKVYDGQIGFDRSPDFGGLRVIATLQWDSD